jgi:hypothetical protein
MKRYSSTIVYKRWDGKRVYKTTKYPIIKSSPMDILIISGEADYLDTLAYKYYRDPTLWWIIACANNVGKGRLSVDPGNQLRIPMDISKILNDFNQLNK